MDFFRMFVEKYRTDKDKATPEREYLKAMLASKKFYGSNFEYEPFFYQRRYLAQNQSYYCDPENADGVITAVLGYSNPASRYDARKHFLFGNLVVSVDVAESGRLGYVDAYGLSIHTLADRSDVTPHSLSLVLGSALDAVEPKVFSFNDVWYSALFISAGEKLVRASVSFNGLKVTVK